MDHLVSVITPTHDPRYLFESYLSLVGQTHPHWEWILVPNQGAVIPDQIASDPRVHVHPFSGSSGIGELKRFGFNQASGILLVELDHDDLLAPNCLAALCGAAQLAEPGFYYSDFVRFAHDENGFRTTPVYDPTFGFSSYPCVISGQSALATRAFPPEAQAMLRIGSAPNHVRAWSKVLYDRLGGHDATLSVCDDFDLVCRTYASGAPFTHIREPLYLYREHVEQDLSNTYRSRQDDITRLEADLVVRHGRSVVEAWAKRRGLPLVDLGGRFNRPDGYIGLDKRSGADIQADALRLPFATSSIGVLRAVDFLEHIPIGRTVAAMNEFYRVLAPGGWLLSDTPSTGGYGAFCDPTHVSFWNALSFRYYYNRNYAKYVPEITCRFGEGSVWESFPSEDHKRNRLLYVRADLFALKGQLIYGTENI